MRMAEKGMNGAACKRAYGNRNKITYVLIKDKRVGSVWNRRGSIVKGGVREMNTDFKPENAERQGHNSS